MTEAAPREPLRAGVTLGASTPHPARDPRGWVSDPRVALLPLVTLCFALQRPAHAFLYDALGYWSSAVAVIAGTDVVTPPGLGFSQLDLRGVLTPFVFTPAAWVADQLALEGTRTVLWQNSLVLGILSTVIIPSLASRGYRPRYRTVALTSLLAWTTVGRFAPQALMDVWALTSVLLAILGLVTAASGRRRNHVLIASGALMCVGVGLRPSYLAFGVLSLVLVGIWYRIDALWAILGAFLAALPQMFFNLGRGFLWSLSPFPPMTNSLAVGQAGGAVVVVRYDTVIDGANPRLGWCSPEFATAMRGELPESTSDLARIYASRLPESLEFVGQKIAAGLYWPRAAPYYTMGTSWIDDLVGLVTIASTVTGSVLLLTLLIRARSLGALSSGYRGSTARLAILSLALGSATALTMIVSATETRFALAWVAVGIVGVAAAVEGGVTTTRAGVLSPRREWFVLVVVCAGLTLVLGMLASTGMAHPFPGLSTDTATILAECAAE